MKKFVALLVLLIFTSIIAIVAVSNAQAKRVEVQAARQELSFSLAPDPCTFFDDFSDPSSGWPIFVGSDYDVGYENDKYKMQMDTKVFWVGNTNTWCDDPHVEVDASVIDYTNPYNHSIRFGILFRYTDPSNWYAFEVSPDDGYFRVTKRVGGVFSDLVPWTYSDIINQGLASNHLVVDASGTQISVGANGQHLAITADASHSSGHTGLTAGTSVDQSVWVNFDNFASQGDIYYSFLPVSYQNYCPDFYDDFGNPASGWPVGEDNYVRFGYTSGEYQVRSKAAGFFYLFESPSCPRDGYTVEADARWVGVPGNSYGLIFGISADYARYYLFDVNTDYRMFRLLYRSPSGWTVLVEPTTAGAVLAGNATNHLRVTRTGQSIRLEVNGVHLRTYLHSGTNGYTTAGIVSSSYSSRADSDARFDNFSMTHEPSAGDTGDSFAQPYPAARQDNEPPASEPLIVEPLLPVGASWPEATDS